MSFTVNRRLVLFWSLALTGVWLSAVPEARAIVDLEWRPECQAALPSGIVEIGLYAVAVGASPQSISVMDVILSWNPAYLRLVGVEDNGPYTWLFSGFSDDSGLDGLNDTWLDGDGLYSALAKLGLPAWATSQGLLVTTFRFQTLDITPDTLLVVPMDSGTYTHTHIYSGDTPGLEIQGVMGRATVGIGFYGTFYAELTCVPGSGTLPFQSHIAVRFSSGHPEQYRRLAGRIDVDVAGGQHYSNWRSGYTNLPPGDCFRRDWTQLIPFWPSVVGDNIFRMHIEDVTPSPYNQPPYAPAGETATDVCTISGQAP